MQSIYVPKSHPYVLFRFTRDNTISMLDFAYNKQPDLKGYEPLSYFQVFTCFNGNHRKIRNYLKKYGTDWLTIDGKIYYSDRIISMKDR